MLSSWVLHWSRPTLRVQPKSPLFCEASLNHTVLRDDDHPPLWAPTPCLVISIYCFVCYCLSALNTFFWILLCDTETGTLPTLLPFANSGNSGEVRWREDGLASSCMCAIPVNVAPGSRGWFRPPNSYLSPETAASNHLQDTSSSWAMPSPQKFGPSPSGSLFKLLRKEPLPGGTTSLGLNLSSVGHLVCAPEAPVVGSDISFSEGQAPGQ